MSPDGPALVLAGAGSGKTRIITYRVARLLEMGVSPENILLLTFTKKAAGEMLRRVRQLSEIDTNKITGGTFHHVGNLLLRKHGDSIGIQRDYSILDRDDSRSLIDDLIKEKGYDVRFEAFPRGRMAIEIFGYASSTGRDIADAIAVKCRQFSSLNRELEDIFQLYEERKRLRNYLDFDDLLICLCRLLKDCPKLTEFYRERFRYILVDEYQDTNALQSGLIKNLAGKRRNVMAVGDDAQSIYSFRGAAYRNIRRFSQDYPDCKIYTVETNYRSTPEILNLANQVLIRAGNDFKKNLRPSLSRGPLPLLIKPNNIYDQGNFVAGRISELIDAGVDPAEIAVLYRSHYHSMEIQIDLARLEIPFRIRSGLRFFAQAHIKDVLAYLKIIDNPLDEVAWKRVLITLPRIGKKTAEKIWVKISETEKPMAALESGEFNNAVGARASSGFQRLIKTIGNLNSLSSHGPADMISRILEGEYDDYLKSKYLNYSNRLEDIQQLENYSLDYESLHDFLIELAMSGRDEAGGNEGDDENAVILSSIHQAKGLEWDTVFIVWLAEGRFPAAPSYNDDEAMEEERRLFYVAITRCRRNLYLLSPLSARGRAGMEGTLKPSRFLTDISPEYYDAWDFFDIDF